MHPLAVGLDFVSVDLDFVSVRTIKGRSTKVGDRFQNIAIISVIPNMVKAGYRG
jgi:hypothetical protein